MDVRGITAKEAIEIASREESHFFDLKAAAIAPKKVERIAVAFANADGGEFLVGVADSKEESDVTKRWQGFSTIEEMNGLLQALFSLSPALDLRYELLRLAGQQSYVLRVNVEKSESVHQTSDGTVYIRHGAQCLPIKDPLRIAELSFAKGATSYENAIHMDIPTETVVDSVHLKNFLEDIAPRMDPLDFVLNQNLIDLRNWQPRTAGILLFAANPSALIPRKCSIKITRYETAEDDPERDHLSKQVTVSGNIYDSIHEAVAAVKTIMSSVEVWTPKGLRELEYPPEAIWEIVVNAVIHRDYAISDDIQILIYDNRIEIASPGRLPGYVNVKNILDARYSRNPKIVGTLIRYRNAPNKDLGEGLNTTFQKMKEWGFKQPEISEDGNYVRVVLPHARLAAPTQAIMEFLRAHQVITNRQAREITGIRSENLVKVEFYKLRDEGFIDRVPGLAGPKSAWQLTDAGRAKSAID